MLIKQLMTKLVFLGTGGAGFIGSSRQLSSVYFDGILLDCGAGVVGRLEDLKLIDNVNTILITHLHSDHFGGLFDLLVHLGIKENVAERRGIKKEKRKLEIYSPVGLKDLIKSEEELGQVYSFVFSYLDIKFIDIDKKLRFIVEDKKVTAIEMDHNKTLNFGYLIETSGFRLFYTGDTREPSNLLRLKADYLIHEATFLEKDKDLAKNSGHSTVREAAEAALKVGAKRLFITHIGSFVTSNEAAEKEARTVFENTSLPDDLQEFELS